MDGCLHGWGRTFLGPAPNFASSGALVRAFCLRLTHALLLITEPREPLVLLGKSAINCVPQLLKSVGGIGRRLGFQVPDDAIPDSAPDLWGKRRQAARERLAEASASCVIWELGVRVLADLARQALSLLVCEGRRWSGSTGPAGASLRGGVPRPEWACASSRPRLSGGDTSE